MRSVNIGKICCGRIFAWGLCALLAKAAFAQAPLPDSVPVVRENITIKLSEHVYVIPQGKTNSVPNVGIVVGTRATLVVDPGLGIPGGKAVLREVAKISRNREIYVATTHFHAEHITGGAAFPSGARFVRPKVQQQDIDELGTAFLELFRKQIGRAQV